MHEYRMKGTCATRLRFDIVDGKIHGLAFDNGCNGNLKAIALLVEGMEAEKVAALLRDNLCAGRKTSCAGQLSQAVDSALKANSAF
jgi:uncharacterized protein (TIGR03905 family)